MTLEQSQQKRSKEDESYLKNRFPAFSREFIAKDPKAEMERRKNEMKYE